MRINPCHGCPLSANCDLKKEYKKKVSGCGAQSVTFKCPILEKEFYVGRRVIIKHPFEHECSSYFEEIRIEKVNVKASIQSVNAKGFSALIDRGQDVDDKYRRRRTMPFYRLVSFLNEPDAETVEYKNPFRNDSYFVLKENDDELKERNGL